MNLIVKNSIRFVAFFLLQALVFNQIEIGFGIHLMVQPLFIMLLPFETGVFTLMILGFTLGLLIDIFSNTYGLHASSLLLMAYMRPIIFKFYGPREGYDPLKEPSVFDMGSRWFFFVFGYLILIHHFWFFLIEVFIISYLLCIVLQTFLIKKSKTK
jgi:hypothetical protein